VFDYVWRTARSIGALGPVVGSFTREGFTGKKHVRMFEAPRLRFCAFRQRIFENATLAGFSKLRRCAQPVPRADQSVELIAQAVLIIEFALPARQGAK